MKCPVKAVRGAGDRRRPGARCGVTIGEAQAHLQAAVQCATWHNLWVAGGEERSGEMGKFEV